MRRRLPSGLPQTDLEGEPKTAVSNPGVIANAAVVVPKLKADSDPSDAGEASHSLSQYFHNLLHHAVKTAMLSILNPLC